MQLHYKLMGSGDPLVILHGLFGMLDNWQSAGRMLSEDFRVYLVDQRNHGKSPHSPEHSYKLLSEDLLTFLDTHHLDKVHLLGHSMGGKTAMQFALDHPERVRRLIVVDMGVKRYDGNHDNIFNALFSLNLREVHRRSDAEKILHGSIPDPGTRQFVLKNLSRQPDGSYRWKFNLESLYANYESGILAPVEGERPFTGKTLFIRGEHSSYITDADRAGIKALFPDSAIVTLRGAGHWVHADKPEELVRTVQAFLTVKQR